MILCDLGNPSGNAGEECCHHAADFVILDASNNPLPLATANLPSGANMAGLTMDGQFPIPAITNTWCDNGPYNPVFLEMGGFFDPNNMLDTPPVNMFEGEVPNSFWTPIRITKGSSATGASLTNKICCIHNDAKHIEFTNSGDQSYWEDEIPFCNLYDPNNTYDGTCNKVTAFSTPAPSDSVTISYSSVETWSFDYVDLGLNTFDDSEIVNDPAKDLLCGLALNDWPESNSTIKGCEGFTMGSSPGRPLLCGCPGPDDPGCDTLEHLAGGSSANGDTSAYCLGETYLPCNVGNYINFCDTGTIDGGETTHGNSCNAGNECSCGQLDYCGVCNGNNPDQSCCGGTADYCGDCTGQVEWGFFGNRVWDPTNPVSSTEDYDSAGQFCKTDYSCAGANTCDDLVGQTVQDGYPMPWGYEGSTYPAGYCHSECGGQAQTGQFCYCDCFGGLPTPKTCYNLQTSLEQIVPACQVEGNNESCESIVWPDDTSVAPGMFTSDETAIFDVGCLDDTACNYLPTAELDCNGKHDAEGGFMDDGGWDSCCVKPGTYCINDGLTYIIANSSTEVAGSNILCDVDVDGNVLTPLTACPMCDCGIGDFDCPYVECNMDNPAQNLRGYGDHGEYTAYESPLTPMLMTANGLSNMSCNTLNGSCYMYAGLLDIEIPYEMTDASEFEVTGCNDPAALNFGDTSPLYMDPTYDLANQAPVTSCQYCPGGPDETGEELSYSLGCTAGYEFYWDEHAVGATSAATVTDSSWIVPTAFDLGSNMNSSVLEDSAGIYTSGACYCRTDLNFLVDMTYRVVGWENDLSSQGDTYNGAIQFNQFYGTQIWDGYGRLQKFTTGGENCLQSTETCQDALMGLGGSGADYDTIPDSIGNLSHLEYLDLSKNYLTGQIPAAIEGLAINQSIQYMDFSFNSLTQFDKDQTTGHGIYLGSDYYGICAMADPDYLGYPQEPNPWLVIKGNKICPTVESDINNTMSYPECLAPPPGYEWGTSDIFNNWCEWIYQHLGFADIPCYNSYNTEAQNLFNPALINTDLDSESYNPSGLICTIMGCRDPEALNYWPEATEACPNNDCCSYDRFFHFPWGEGGGPEGDMNPGASYGGHMSLYQMVQALHADIYGWKYNSWGSLDVTTGNVTLSNISANDYECLQANEFNGMGAFLTTYQINSCDYQFQNDPSGGGTLSEYYDGDGIIDHWDGLWLRDSGYEPLFQDEPLMGYCNIIDPANNPAPCAGDARPIEFINRVEWAAHQTSNASGFRDYWFSFFPPGGQDISFTGIQYIEDYDLNGTGNLDSNDGDLWTYIGRGDIAALIENSFTGMAYPEYTPEDVELWEQAPAMVSMSYSQDFVTEADAGFTLYPQENSPGVLTRNGQWYCDDGGNSEICYEDIYACGRAPSWVEECAPCGSGGICIPITLKTSAEGHDKISKTKLIQVPYFSNRNSSTLVSDDIYTGSISSSNQNYYYSVLDGPSDSPGSSVQFYVSWGHFYGSGSLINGGSIYNTGTSEAIYKQYSSLLLDDLAMETGFLISSGSDINAGGVEGDIDRWIYILNFKRNNFEDQLQVGNWVLHVSGAKDDGDGKMIHLTDNSKALTIPTINTAAGRRYDIVSGSYGKIDGNSSGFNSRYGSFYPDFGIMIFGEKLSDELPGTSLTPAVAKFGNAAEAHNQLMPLTGSGGEEARNALRFINCLKNVKQKGFNEGSYEPDVQLTGDVTASLVASYKRQISGSGTSFTTELADHTHIKIESGSYSQILTIDTIESDTSMSVNEDWAPTNPGSQLEFASSSIYKISPIPVIKLYGEKEATEVIYVCRIPGDSFNFTNNFSILSGSGRQMYSPDTGVMNSFNTSTTASVFLTDGEPSIMISSSDQNSSYPDAIETQTTLENGEIFIWPGINVTTMHGFPTTFITGVELFDEHGECLATARTSKPIKKAFDRESVIKVKLIF